MNTTQRLGTCALNTSTMRKELEDSFATSKAATSIMLEAQRSAEASLQTRNSIRVRTEALVSKASRGRAKTVDLHRELANCTLDSLEAVKDHDVAMKDVWRGWQATTTGIMRMEWFHQKVLRALDEMEKDVEKEGGQEEENAKDVRSAIDRENKKLLEKLVEVADCTERILREALKELDDHKIAWGYIERELGEATNQARKAIAEVTRVQRMGG
ncbi:hypothetical protein K504DRAFT_452968 [Pleomassaria siparia CBS 279.74]|uniref:Uncharacterized protein n=1 Tax=Pleomassaria siparia CBS 279.74 TaxID=1314801 RepID=A0A6G1JR10_9PLEO|nr:hypothetical protein K504DRAFT_452968 [Pleomassaria siparia CBS 279.74]